MDNDLKRQLLKRKFSSIEYMEEMMDWHERAIESLVSSLQHFYRYPPQIEDWHNWHKSDWPETWEQRVLTNLRDTQKGIEDGIQRAREGDLSYIESSAAVVHSIFRNLDNVGWGWWDHIDSTYKQEFDDNLVKASKIASNIMWTLAKVWKDDEILDEEITGVVPDAELLRYLKPGEKP